MGRVRAYVGLGSNVGDPEATLGAAIRALAAMPDVRQRGVSRLFATRPVGVTEQPEFRNAVVALDVPAGPTPEIGASALLVALKELERAFGRLQRARWGPRELDLDLLIFGRHRNHVEPPPEGHSQDRDEASLWLDVPHPLAQERLFVLAPLSDLASGLVPPGWGESVETARRRQELVEGSDSVRAVAIWDPPARWQAIGPSRAS